MAFRRQVKNVVRNFSDIEVKVREATSNDPWGPSSSLMGEIADATYNVTAFSSIMSMLWKRLNDHGKNWRHVYKSLTVLDYIIKTGNERVAQQCRENLFAIQTLKDFQFIDKDGKDQGINVREKSKQIVALLKDDERLKNERQRSLKAKERFAQSQGGVGNKNFYKQNKKFTSSYPSSSDSLDRSRTSQDDSSIPTSSSWQPGKSTEFDSKSTDGRLSSEFEKARPTNEQEEEMQLQIALAMSREEAEQGKKVELGDERRLAMALQESASPGTAQPTSSTLLDLTAPINDNTNNQSSNLDPWASSATPANQFSQAPPMSQPTFAPSNPTSSDPWGNTQDSQTINQQSYSANQSSFSATDPWSSNQAKDPFSAPQSDPWESNTQTAVDPWAHSASSQPGNIENTQGFIQSFDSNASNGFDPRATNADQQLLKPSNPFDMSGVNDALGDSNSDPFLGTSSRLVDLNDIVGSKASEKSANPFATTIPSKTTNPFAVEKPKAKSINELRSQQTTFASAPTASSNELLPSPLVPQTNNNTQASNSSNPFLL